MVTPPPVPVGVSGGDDPTARAHQAGDERVTGGLAEVKDQQVFFGGRGRGLAIRVAEQARGARQHPASPA